MKQLCATLLFVLFISFSQAQIVNIPDANFKNALINTNCVDSDGNGSFDSDVDLNNDGEVQVEEANIVTALSVQFQNISSLEGIQSFINLEELRCNNNELTALDLSGVNNIEILDCYNNQIGYLDVSNFVNQSYINCNDNLITELNVGELNYIIWMQCRNNLLTTLDMSGSVFLEVLICSNNNLESLFIKNGSDETAFGISMGNAADSLNFNGNPNLEYICTDDEEMSEVENLIANYGYDCEVNSYCRFGPGGSFYLVQGQHKLDIDNNGCDDEDVIFPYLQIESFNENGESVGINISNTTGSYSIPFLEGNYSIEAQLEHPNYFNLTPPSFSVDFPSQESPFVQDFCITPNGSINDLEVVIIPLEEARPGFDVTYKVFYRNKGNSAMSGNIEFDFSENSELMEFLSAQPSESSVSDNIISWDYSDLLPFESREIYLSFNLNTPTDTPPLNDGDSLGFVAWIYPLSGDELPGDNKSEIKQIVVNSFDPNDITCLEGETIAPEDVGKYVHYLIRFENIGTASAVNIVVKDVIDTSKFDISTLVPLNASHDFVTRIQNTNEVEFIFEGINLPFDDASNDGYVLFKIKILETLVLGDSFTNSAEIYFDFNAPIITNEYLTTVEENLSTNNYNYNSVRLYPNPVIDKLFIDTKLITDYIYLHDINGRLLKKVNSRLNDSLIFLDFSLFDNGVYFLTVESEGKKTTKKVIVRKP